ncbi:hypothetical protein H5410_055817 [Solanum commersonii]|uniref:Uncharacterized protein n=1 Tax=Solanum commersonii TaxID=4109 RepID=A0A9J5WIK8_SOLCO|nr:hypothetical protein H5410_055817 [Solanum commersonii]
MLLNDDGIIDTQVHGVDIHLDHESIILEVPRKRVGSVEGCVPSDSYVKSVVKVEDLGSSGILKKSLRVNTRCILNL